MRILWICHFSNSSIRDQLFLSNCFFENIVRKTLCKKKRVYVDYAPWVTNMIKEFEQFNDVELHIIAPHSGMKNWRQEFEMKGVHYHFFKKEMSFPFNKIERRISKKQHSEFPRNRQLVKQYVDGIRPDLVMLIGAENPYYSVASLDVKDVPLFLLCQTVYSNPNRTKYQENISQLIWNTEQQIFKNTHYYACTGRMYYDLIKGYVSDAVIFPLTFPSEKLPMLKELPKKYDFVWFAQNISIKKGIDNAIEAMALVKKERKNISLLVVGSCNEEYKIELEKQIEKLNLSENIAFHDYFPNHNDMLQYIKQAKYALLPIKMDIISGTVMEAMYIGLPVVTFKTSGTPRLNIDGESVLISDINDNQALAENMLRLINSQDLCESLKINAKKWIDKYMDNTKNARRIVEQCKVIINNYYHQKPIPSELLFNENDYPNYK